MKLRLLLLALLVVAVSLGLGITVAWSVWYAQSHTPTAQPGAVEQSRAALDQQFAQSQKQEAEIEKLYWNQPDKLARLIDAHKQRIDKLTGNHLAGNPSVASILTHDQQAIARLNQRIEAIAAARQAAAEAEAEAEKQAALEAREQGLSDAGGSTAAPQTAPHMSASH